MTAPFRGSFVTDDDIRRELATRRRTVVFQTARAANEGALVTLIESKATEGWRISKRNRASVRLEKDKPSGERFEDEVWSIIARLGFSNISSGRDFQVLMNGTYRQVDVVAADDESAIFIECTQSDVPKKKSMTQLVDKVTSFQQSARRDVQKHFGGKKLKTGWVIATRNIEWGQRDLDRARDAKITVLHDQQIDYFDQLVSHLKFAARFQFLAFLFQGGKVSELNLRVPATRAQMGGRQFYNFVIRPADLLKIAYVSHKASADIQSINTYQRLIKMSRLKKIAQYVDNGGQFPTNVVVNVHTARPLKFEAKERIGASAVGTLYLPAEYGCAWVIDGQHRLFGYAHSKRAVKSDDKTTFPILAYEGLPSNEEAQMFVDINHEQKQVSKNLLNEIYSTLHWNHSDFNLRIGSLASRLVLALNDGPASAMKGRILVTASRSSQTRCLTSEQLRDPLISNTLFGEVRPGGAEIPGPLCDSRQSSLDRTYEKAYEFLSTFFRFVAETAPTQYSLGKAEGGYLWTNGGVRPLIGVLARVLEHIATRDQAKLDLLDADDFFSDVAELIAPLILHFENSSLEEISAFRSRRAMQGVTKNEFEMMKIINGHEQGFNPTGLVEYIQSLDEEGTKEARNLIDEIEKRIHDYVLHELQNQYKNSWWKEGIPERIRERCAGLQEKDPDAKEDKWQYLYLIDNRDIALANWSFLGNAFSLSGEGNKKRRTEWLVDLNRQRNTTHHVIKGVLNRDEVISVKNIHKQVFHKMALSDSN